MKEVCKVNLFYSSLKIILCCVLFWGCYGRSSVNTPLATNSSLFAHSTIVTNQEISEYLEYIAELISIGLKTKHTFRISLLSTKDAVAFSTDEGALFISKGLALNLKSEGEFVFVMAHEAAHIELGHIEVLKKNKGKAVDTDQLYQYEFSADSKALQAIYKLGYDPACALKALSNAYGFYESTETHPSSKNRILNMKRMILPMQTHSSFVSPQRDFHRFLNYLKILRDRQ